MNEMRAATRKAGPRGKEGALATATAAAAPTTAPATTPAPWAWVVRHHLELRGRRRDRRLRLRLRLRHEGGVALLLNPQRLEHESVVLRSAGLTGASEGASAGLSAAEAQVSSTPCPSGANRNPGAGGGARGEARR